MKVMVTVPPTAPVSVNAESARPVDLRNPAKLRRLLLREHVRNCPSPPLGPWPSPNGRDRHCRVTLDGRRAGEHVTVPQPSQRGLDLGYPLHRARGRPCSYRACSRAAGPDWCSSPGGRADDLPQPGPPQCTAKVPTSSPSSTCQCELASSGLAAHHLPQPGRAHRWRCHQAALADPLVHGHRATWPPGPHRHDPRVSAVTAGRHRCGCGGWPTAPRSCLRWTYPNHYGLLRFTATSSSLRRRPTSPSTSQRSPPMHQLHCCSNFRNNDWSAKPLDNGRLSGTTRSPASDHVGGGPPSFARLGHVIRYIC